MTSTILFLCTGNYFRSRYAEILFNRESAVSLTGWKADSRGVAIETGTANIGPISPHTLRRLRLRGIVSEQPHRQPQPLELSDLLAASRIIALKEAEHRPLLRARFSDWADTVEYWHVDDIDCAHPDTALDLIEREVERLLAQLAGR